jgi:hypothetical protein
MPNARGDIVSQADVATHPPEGRYHSRVDRAVSV